MHLPGYFWLAPLSSAVALAAAWFFYRQVMAESEGTDTMRTIARHIRDGAGAYLRQQYKVVGVFFLVIAVLLGLMAYGAGLLNPWAPFAFLTAGCLSALAGFLGMKTATGASARVAQACRDSLDKGLRVSFRAGAVMGLVVVGLALLDASLWFGILSWVYRDEANGLLIVTTSMMTFVMGASAQALFARVGGRIYTKAADVGADLAGKVESGIPEDDPRNPATIADNVGDNVGDVAGMGADLYESYYGSILAAAALGAAAFAGREGVAWGPVLAPMVIAAVGILSSLCGVFAVRVEKDAGQEGLMSALHRGVRLSTVLNLAGSWVVLRVLGVEPVWGVWGAVASGLVAGGLIGRSIEYYTSFNHKPTLDVARNAAAGPATVIIAGMGWGMLSTAAPVMITALGIFLAYGFACGFQFDELTLGLYGVSVASVGMLSTLGVTLATDAYGPIADNAGGNAEMSGLPPEVRERTDGLDAMGNITAATGKGYAIGSAALTALALLASYLEQVRMALVREGVDTVTGAAGPVEVARATLRDLAAHFDLSVLNPAMLLSVFLGSMLAFVFCGLTMNAVGRVAARMVEEVRRQFREIPGIMEKRSTPDYAQCVAIATRGAQREMLAPALMAVAAPVAVGWLFGVPGVMGLLLGSLSTGFVMAIFMANAGGAWDNAKKYIETGQMGGKGSEAHKAAVIGDTVGDPFKDTSGPSLNILIKLMSIVSIVVAGWVVAHSLF